MTAILRTSPTTEEEEPTTITPGPVPDPAAYHMLVVGVSGKDGDAALWATLEAARAAGVEDRVFTAHADLGLVEWPSVTHKGIYYPSNREMVELSANHFGIPRERQIYTRRTVTDGVSGIVRPQSLLEQVADRRKFPDMARRFCTSDHKSTKIMAALTPHVRDLRRALGRRQVRILNITGIRADESPRRRELTPYKVNKPNSNSFRHVDDWLPVHTMTTEQVRELVDTEGCGHHWAYDSEPGARDWKGMSRLSCSLCILSNKVDLILAICRRPRLAALYAEVEAAIGHSFREGMSIADLIKWATDSVPHPYTRPGVVLDENTPEFDAFAAAVRARLVENPTPLRGGTEFNTIPLAGAACVGCR